MLIIFQLACVVLTFIQNEGLDEIIKPGAKPEKLADGFLFAEVPASEAKVNACFGGEDIKNQFINSNKSPYRIRTKIKGAC